MRIKAGTGGGGLCGIATTASYPVKTHSNPKVGKRGGALGHFAA
jgi:hypothetical protein